SCPRAVWPRTNRWWLFAAESIRWPTTSFFVHRPGAGHSSLSASENQARTPGSVRTANRRRSSAAVIWLIAVSLALVLGPVAVAPHNGLGRILREGRIDRGQLAQQ